MVTANNEYRTRSDFLWDEAQVALQAGNPVQASEKLWGAGAQAVKAAAEAKGWPHASHRDLYEAVGRLSSESGQRRITELFAIASALLQNFYEWWMPLGEVQELSASVQELRDILFQLLDNPVK